MEKTKLIWIDATGGQTYGSKFHISALVDHFVSGGMNVKLVVYVKEPYLDPILSKYDGLKIIIVPLLRNKILRILFTSIWLPISCIINHVDLVYYPFDIGPLIKSKTKVVLGIKNPNLILPKELITLKFSRFHSWLCRFSAKNVDLFLYPSNFALQSIGSKLSNGIQRGKYVYHGLDFSDWDSMKSDDKDFEGNFILFCSNLYKFKNLEVLIRALNTVVNKLERDLELVVIGDFVDSNYDFKIKSELKKLNLDKVVHFYSNLPRHKVIQYYRNCRLIVIPTKFETFGHMYLEAKKSRKPIIVADIPVAREILNESVVYFKPDNHDELVQKIVEVIDETNADLNEFYKEFDFSQFRIQHECNQIFKYFLKQTE
jgi:glycosyltransferase involved in cell wall biosynthesis